MVPSFKTETVMTPAKANKLEALRSRPRRRPDWTDMMKEVESGRKLRHVECNDRSAPIIPQEKTKGQGVRENVLSDNNGTSNNVSSSLSWYIICQQQLTLIEHFTDWQDSSTDKIIAVHNSFPDIKEKRQIKNKKVLHNLIL